MQTFFTEAEYIVKSPPLTHISGEPQDPVIICPNDILLRMSSEIAPGIFTDQDLIVKKRLVVVINENNFPRHVADFIGVPEVIEIAWSVFCGCC